jgi:anti-anti-sigma factor
MFEVRVDEHGVITLSGSITIKNIEGIYQEMMKIYDDTQCTAIDMTGINDADTAGLQLLLSFVKSFREIGTKISCITNPSIDDILEITGLRRNICVA